MRTALYRIFGDEDFLLYIGISDRFGRRWTEHARVQPWWPEMRWQTVHWYDSREDAEDAERAAIKAEHPKYNIAHTAERPPRSYPHPLDEPGPWLLVDGGMADTFYVMRRRAGFSMKRLRTQLGWSYAKLSDIEMGRRVPSDEDIEAWGKALDAPEATDDLFEMLADRTAVIFGWPDAPTRPTRARWWTRVYLDVHPGRFREIGPTL